MPTVLAMGGCDRATVSAALELAREMAVRQHSQILIVGVASRRLSWEHFAPMTGYMSASEVEQLALDHVRRLIRDCVADLPEQIQVRHASCTGWGDACLRRLVAAEGNRTLIVAHPHPRVLARWAGRRLASAIGAQLVLVSANGHERAPGAAMEPSAAGA